MFNCHICFTVYHVSLKLAKNQFSSPCERVQEADGTLQSTWLENLMLKFPLSPFLLLISMMWDPRDLEYAVHKNINEHHPLPGEIRYSQQAFAHTLKSQMMM